MKKGGNHAPLYVQTKTDIPPELFHKDKKND